MMRTVTTYNASPVWLRDLNDAGGAADAQRARRSALAATRATVTASLFVGAPPLVTLPVDFDGE